MKELKEVIHRSCWHKLHHWLSDGTFVKRTFRCKALTIFGSIKKCWRRFWETLLFPRLLSFLASMKYDSDELKIFLLDSFVIVRHVCSWFLSQPTAQFRNIICFAYAWKSFFKFTSFFFISMTQCRTDVDESTSFSSQLVDATFFIPISVDRWSQGSKAFFLALEFPKVFTTSFHDLREIFQQRTMNKLSDCAEKIRASFVVLKRWTVITFPSILDAHADSV